MRVVIAVLIGFVAVSSVLGQTSPDQRGTPVIPINRLISGESVVIARNQAWRVQTTDHFDIYHQAAQREADAAALEAERAYARISVTMNHELTARMPLILVANDADLPRTAEQAYQLVAASGAPMGAEHLLLSDETVAQRPYWVAHELTHPFLFELLPAPQGLRRVGVRVTGRPSQRDVATCGRRGGARCADKRPCASSREPDCFRSSLGTCDLRLHRLGRWQPRV